MDFLGFDPGQFIASLGHTFETLLPQVGGRFQAPEVQPERFQVPQVAGGGFGAPVLLQGGGFQSPTIIQGGFQATPTFGNGGFAAPVFGQQVDWGDPNAYWNHRNAREAAERAVAPQSNSPGTASPGGMDFTGPATADDNKTLTGQKIDAWLAQTRPGGPMTGLGQYILDEANRYNVSAPELLGIFLKESELGTTAGPGWNIAGVGGQGNFHGYPDIRAAIDGAAANLGSGLYKGHSMQDHIGYWFVGTDYQQKGGLQATDSTGGRNGTVQDYLDVISQVYQQLGVSVNQGAAPQQRVGGGDLIGTARSLAGTPYELGGLRTHPNNPRAGLDCSEFTAWVYQQHGITLPWNAQAQFDATTRIQANQLQPGDLVFFQGTTDQPGITHVGMYIGNGRMINSQDGGVMEADLSTQYWRDRIAGYGRVGMGAR